MSDRVIRPPGERSIPDVDRIVRKAAGCDQPAFGSALGAVTWQEWSAAVQVRLEAWNALSRRPVGLLLRPAPTSYASFCALIALGCHVYLLDSALNPESNRELAERHGMAAIVDPEDLDGRCTRELGPDGGQFRLMGQGEITLFTSGSTGAPKAVRHDWHTLCRPVRFGQSSSRQTWLLTYRPHLYAGLQVFLHCLLNLGTMVIPDPLMSVRELIGLIRQHGVRQVSATPSFWRRLITLGAREELLALEMDQITLGGEVSDQPLLDALRRLFPGARVVHIYATSELGRCFSVRDGLAGFPSSYLDGLTAEGVELRVVDGELQVRSANAMLLGREDTTAGHGEARWVASGDLVELSADRYLFVGRRAEMINVGGNKVHPQRVEQVVQGVPGVLDSCVFGKASSLVGQMVACELVVAADHDPEAVKQEVLRRCRERLAAHERPRFLHVVGEINLSAAGKKLRSGSSATSGVGRRSET